MAPEDLDQPAGYEELSPRALEITRDQDRFDHDIFAQEAQTAVLRSRWKSLNPKDQNLLLQQYALLFPRSREHDNPQACLKKILQLPTGEDVQRALRVRADTYVAYKGDPGEEIYPGTGWLGRYLDYARWNKVPLALHFWAGLSILGAAVRRNYFLDNNITYVWMNQFIVLTGSKGTGKSAAKSIAKDILYRMNRKLAQMEEQNKIAKASAFQIPMIPSDITPQDLVKQLAEWSALPRHIQTGSVREQEQGEAVAILISDELSNLAGKGTHGASLMVPLLCELCFESTYSKSTISGGKQFIDRMAFSILACTQPGWMRETVVSDAKEGGFIERVNFIHRPASQRMYNWLEIPIVDPLQAENLADELVLLATRMGDPQVLRITPEGHRFHADWYKREWDKGPRDAADATKHSLDRRCLHMFRLASLLAISEGDSVPWVQLSHLQQALVLIEAEDEYLPLFMSEANETREGTIQREFIAWIASQGGLVKKGVFGAWAGKKYNGILSTQRDELIENLADTGQLIIYKKPGVVRYGLPDGPKP